MEAVRHVSRALSPLPVQAACAAVAECPVAGRNQELTVGSNMKWQRLFMKILVTFENLRKIHTFA